MNAFFRKLGWLMNRRSKEAELQEEIQFHLDEENAESLVREVVTAYTRDHGGPPDELFIHARQRFEDAGYTVERAGHLGTLQTILIARK